MKIDLVVIALGISLGLIGGCSGSESMRDDPEDRVSIGYGNVPKDNVTGSVSVIDSDDIERRRVTELAHLFEGLPGVQVIHTAGGFRLQIRGIHSFTGSNDPLFVLDGTPLQTGPSGIISFINPNDVERIEILKGAAASIYGTRGANGVVLIKTKTVR